MNAQLPRQCSDPAWTSCRPVAPVIVPDHKEGSAFVGKNHDWMAEFNRIAN
jgi:hypothetical protein